MELGRGVRIGGPAVDLGPVALAPWRPRVMAGWRGARSFPDAPGTRRLPPESGLEHADVFSVVAALVEFHHSGVECEQRKVLPGSHVLAGMVGAATLAYEDVSGEDFLSGELLHAQPLSDRIAAIPGASARFLMRHA